MATRTWNSSGSTDANNGNNYSPTGALGTSDDIVLNGTSVVNWIATGTLTVGSVTINSSYTGSTSILSATFSNAAGYTDNGGNATKTHSFNGTLTFNHASAAFVINSAGPVSPYGFLVFNGTTGCTLSGGMYSWWERLTLGAGAKLTLSNTNFLDFYSTTPIVMGNNSTLTINMNLTIRPGASTNTPFTIGTGCTINGNGTVYYEPDIAGLTLGINALTLGGTVSLNCNTRSVANTKFNQVGNVTVGGTFTIKCYDTNGNGFSFDHNDYNVTSADDYILDLSTVVGSVQTINMGNGTFNVKSIWFKTNGGTHNINWENSQWTCSSNIDINASCVFTVGPTHRITQTLASGSSYYTNRGTANRHGYINLNASSNTFQLYTNLYCELLTIAVGTFDRNGYSVIAGYDDIMDDKYILIGDY